jgi:hypothetical protein
LSLFNRADIAIQSRPPLASMSPFMCKVWFATAKRGFVHRLRVREVSIFVILPYGAPADDGAGRRAPGPTKPQGSTRNG